MGRPSLFVKTGSIKIGTGPQESPNFKGRHLLLFGTGSVKKWGDEGAEV